MTAKNTQQDALFHQVINEMRTVLAEVTTLRSEMQVCKAVIEPVARIVRGDAGVQSLSTLVELNKAEMSAIATRVNELAKAFQAIEPLRSKIEEIKKMVDDVEKATASLKANADSIKGGWAVIAAVVTGGLALIGTIITAAIGLLHK